MIGPIKGARRRQPGASARAHPKAAASHNTSLTLLIRQGTDSMDVALYWFFQVERHIHGKQRVGAGEGPRGVGVRMTRCDAEETAVA